MRDRSLLRSHAFEAAVPLRQRVPVQDEDGGALSDFMMIIPKLRNKPREYIMQVVCGIEMVLENYRHAVVFADLNMRLNLLWISFRPLPGMCLELSSAIKTRVPEALLVGHAGN
jgi:hypothetical protein